MIDVPGCRGREGEGEEEGKGEAEGEGEGEGERELPTDSFTPLEGLVDNGILICTIVHEMLHKHVWQNIPQTTCTVCTTDHM